MLPGVVLHLLASVAAWTFVQVNGLMVAGCGSDRSCDFVLTDAAVNGVQPALIVVWAITTALAIARPLAWGRSPWPVLGAGIGVSAVLTVAAYMVLRAGAGVF
ncbi:hypothetical protein SAMN05880568_3066 [Microbacterium sp. RURRCA19A]|nr:hypothetical protein SAMN05880568_3066 [Microbacterium sp. RURRCA19A]